MNGKCHMRIRTCPKCQWRYVLVGGDKEHVCPEKHWVVPVGKPRAAGQGKQARKQGK